MKKVLVAVDGSGNSLRALDFALGLQKLCSAVQVTSLYVGPSCYDLFPEPGACSWIQQKELDKEIEVRAQKVFTKIDELVNQHGLAIEKAIARGDAAEAISMFARKGGYDLVVVGSRGYGEEKGILLGRVSHKVLHICPCPVAIVK
jgi:nucleotide-binding universal stress UspA family protein